MAGHHIQFSVVDSATLRVAGYSDYFVDLDRRHQEKIISSTTQEGFLRGDEYSAVKGSQERNDQHPCNKVGDSGILDV